MQRQQQQATPGAVSCTPSDQQQQAACGTTAFLTIRCQDGSEVRLDTGNVSGHLSDDVLGPVLSSIAAGAFTSGTQAPIDDLPSASAAAPLLAFCAAGTIREAHPRRFGFTLQQLAACHAVAGGWLQVPRLCADIEALVALRLAHGVADREEVRRVFACSPAVQAVCEHTKPWRHGAPQFAQLQQWAREWEALLIVYEDRRVWLVFNDEIGAAHCNRFFSSWAGVPGREDGQPLPPFASFRAEVPGEEDWERLASASAWCKLLEPEFVFDDLLSGCAWERVRTEDGEQEPAYFPPLDRIDAVVGYREQENRLLHARNAAWRAMACGGVGSVARLVEVLSEVERDYEHFQPFVRAVATTFKASLSPQQTQ